MQSIVLEKFDYGIISNPSVEDISDKAACSSLNIDGDSEDGLLKGIPTNTEHTLASSTAYGDVRLGNFVEHSGTYDLIYTDTATTPNSIKRISDFYAVGGGASSVLLSSANISDNTCIQINNKEAHIGTGNASTNVPLWCGRPGHQTFGGIGKVVFTGAGLRDMWVGGSYTGAADATFTIEVDGTGATDTFKWRKDAGSWTTGVSMTDNTALTLQEGITIRFEVKTGHTLTNTWVITVYTQETFISETSYLTSCESGVGTGYVANQITSAKFSFDSNIIYVGVLAGSFFTAGHLFRYKFSVVYDGYQESPLSYNYIDHVAGVTDEYDLTFGLKLGVSATYFTPDDYSKRITLIKIYRADSPTGNAGDLGLYRLVDSVEINNINSKVVVYDSAVSYRWEQYPAGTALVDDDYGTIMGYYSGAWKEEKLLLIKDVGITGASYTEETGMPQTFTNIALNYSLSAKGNGFHFVAKGYHPDVTDASNYIFRSKELRFDQIDVVNDFLVMPRAPVALEFYEGKLYVFDANTIYRINPEGLYIEDAYPGVGALGQRSVLSTPYGMFFCNDNGVYKYTSGQIEPISERIKVSASGGVNWQTIEQGTIADTIVAFDSLKNYIMFIGTRTDTTQKCTVWAYHIIKDRWDYWTLNNLILDANSGVFTGKDGEIYLSISGHTYKLLRSATGLAWEWSSKEFNMGHPSQNKWLGKILADPTTGVTITYGTEGATPSTAYTHGNILDLYKKSLQIKVVGTSNTEVDSVEMIYRLLVGLR